MAEVPQNTVVVRSEGTEAQGSHGGESSPTSESEEAQGTGSDLSHELVSWLRLSTDTWETPANVTRHRQAKTATCAGLFLGLEWQSRGGPRNGRGSDGEHELPRGLLGPHHTCPGH